MNDHAIVFQGDGNGVIHNDISFFIHVGMDLNGCR